MKRFLIPFFAAILGLAALGGIAFAAGGHGSPPSQDATPPAKHGWLGIQIAALAPGLKQQLNLTVDTGVVVVNVQKDSPAAAGGLQRADVVQAVNGKSVAAPQELTTLVNQLAPGTKVTLSIVRGADKKDIAVTLGEKPSPKPAMRPWDVGPWNAGPAGLPLPQLPGILGNLADNFIHATVEVLGPNNTTVTLGLTGGQVDSIAGSVLTVLRKDGKKVQFTTTADTRVLVGGHEINLSGLKQNTPVVVVEKDGAVSAVVAWPGRGLKRGLLPWAGKGQQRHTPPGLGESGDQGGLRKGEMRDGLRGFFGPRLDIPEADQTPRTGGAPAVNF